MFGSAWFLSALIIIIIIISPLSLSLSLTRTPFPGLSFLHKMVQTQEQPSARASERMCAHDSVHACVRACVRASERDLAAKVRERDQMRIPEEDLIHRHAKLERQRHKSVPFLDLFFFGSGDFE
jgi:hypothetical protein